MLEGMCKCHSPPSSPTTSAGEHGHSQTDFDWVFNPQASRSGLWKAVGAYLPHRTIKAVWAASTRMLHSGNYQVKGGMAVCVISWVVLGHVHYRGASLMHHTVTARCYR